MSINSTGTQGVLAEAEGTSVSATAQRILAVSRAAFTGAGRSAGETERPGRYGASSFNRQRHSLRDREHRKGIRDRQKDKTQQKPLPTHTGEVRAKMDHAKRLPNERVPKPKEQPEHAPKQRKSIRSGRPASSGFPTLEPTDPILTKQKPPARTSQRTDKNNAAMPSRRHLG